jgi:hypothetical protein
MLNMYGITFNSFYTSDCFYLFSGFLYQAIQVFEYRMNVHEAKVDRLENQQARQ